MNAIVQRIVKYQGCFYPLLAIIGLLLLLVGLSMIVGFDDAVLPRPDLNRLPNYPDGIAFHESILIADSGMKWMLLTYFYWLVGLGAIVFCGYQLRQALAGFAATERHVIYGIFVAVIVLTITSVGYKTLIDNTPLMSFGFLVDNLALMGMGFIDLATSNMALAYVAIVALLVSMSLLLVPDGHNNDTTEQLRAVTRVMYCGALFLVVWIAQASEMYRFAATLLVSDERQLALDFAPTISLIAGAFASLFLAAAYLAAYLWLQTCYGQRRLRDRLEAENDNSPKKFLLAHWPKITAVLVPALPGIIGQVLHGIAQQV